MNSLFCASQWLTRNDLNDFVNVFFAAVNILHAALSLSPQMTTFATDDQRPTAMDTQFRLISNWTFQLKLFGRHLLFGAFFVLFQVVGCRRRGCCRKRRKLAKKTKNISLPPSVPVLNHLCQRNNNVNRSRLRIHITQTMNTFECISNRETKQKIGILLSKYCQFSHCARLVFIHIRRKQLASFRGARTIQISNRNAKQISYFCSAFIMQSFRWNTRNNAHSNWNGLRLHGVDGKRFRFWPEVWGWETAWIRKTNRKKIKMCYAISTLQIGIEHMYAIHSSVATHSRFPRTFIEHKIIKHLFRRANTFQIFTIHTQSISFLSFFCNFGRWAHAFCVPHFRHRSE